MRNPVTVLTTLLSVEFVLYTVSLCLPEWLIQTEGVSEGLFALCSARDGVSSCTTLPAWLGSYSLSWMFLAASSLLSLTATLTVRPALSRGKRPIAALVLNVLSVSLCAGALVTFLVSVWQQAPELLRHLGWTFYICVSALVYGLLVTALLCLLPEDPGAAAGRVRPAAGGGGGGGGGGGDLSVVTAP